MGLLDRIVPGRKRRTDLGLTIGQLADSARRETELHRLDQRQAALWLALCTGAERIVRQLIVRSDDERIDWGLKRHRAKVDYPRLVAIYWWMLLYQLVLFRNRGLDGYAPDEEMPTLHDLARSFLEREYTKISTLAEPPGPWDDRWTGRSPWSRRWASTIGPTRSWGFITT